LKSFYITATTIICLFLFSYIFQDAIISILSSNRVDFDHIEATGGIDLGSPSLKNNIYYLPVKCSAIGKFANKEPKIFSSAPLAYYKAIVKQKDKEIVFYLKMRMDKNYQETQLKEIELGKLRIDSYKIYYLNRDNSKVFLKEILIK
jgi:hypothetical protein